MNPGPHFISPSTFVFVCEVGSSNFDWAGLELEISCLCLLSSWDYRCGPPCLLESFSHLFHNSLFSLMHRQHYLRLTESQQFGVGGLKVAVTLIWLWFLIIQEQAFKRLLWCHSCNTELRFSCSASLLYSGTSSNGALASNVELNCAKDLFGAMVFSESWGLFPRKQEHFCVWWLRWEYPHAVTCEGWKSWSTVMALVSKWWISPNFFFRWW
jgi:hypothetical protein